jgi:hypothetical protein
MGHVAAHMILQARPTCNGQEMATAVSGPVAKRFGFGLAVRVRRGAGAVERGGLENRSAPNPLGPVLTLHSTLCRDFI